MKKQLLVVEDNELNRAILCEILSDSYRILEAENGQQALDILHQQKDSIALILLDVMMPVMDGYTFLDRVREDRELSRIPVIVTTQSGDEEDEVSALAHGATDFVPKPYRPQVILHRVANLIKLRETAAIVNQFQYDRLTGLYSKEFFYRKVREQLELRPQGKYSLICANVENFKLFNDAFGTVAGDNLLKEIANAFRALAGKAGICGRYRADRFFCFLERNPEYDYRISFGEDGRYCCIVPGKNVAMKWGIYEINDWSIPVERMCDRALLALDSIKGQYNRYYAIYDDRMRASLLREQSITDAMEPALAQGQFLVYLQPKYSLTEHSMAGAEALVRWIHPQWGSISPGEFIPLFEKNGFIPKLDRYVWEQVCALLRDWKQQGRPLLPISVNVSRADVYQGNLVETLPALTRKYGVDPAYLHLEITESAYAENTVQIISTLEQLRNLGFTIEMDDFGSGYSSLNMLSQMKLDILKLEMKFIQNEITKPQEQSILKDIISMAHRMHLSVVAEGVESLDQVQRLRTVGCDYVQGYFFAKPMPVPEFEALCDAQLVPSKPIAPREPPAAPPLPGLLVVDEDQNYCQRVQKAFDGQYQVLTAAEKEQAMDILRDRGSGGIAAVLLSATLPNNGAETLLKNLRQDPAYWDIPVVATVLNGESVHGVPLELDTDDFLCKCHPLFDLHRRIQRLRELSAVRERLSVLQDEASRDPLTGLLNRRGLQAAMASLRKEELPMAVFIFDLDTLKQVNDTCGHQAGDQMIQVFADLLTHSTRHGDILCRYGGDEFIAILKHMGEPNSVQKKGATICRCFQQKMKEEGIPASCSAGVVICGPEERPSEQAIHRADQALYQAKRDNKGGCCLGSKNEQ